MVDFDGSIYWNQQPVTWATLDAYFYAQGQKPVEEQDEIHITANRLAKYDTVAKVHGECAAARRGEDRHRQYATPTCEAIPRPFCDTCFCNRSMRH